jgi:hypothetical protein
MNSVEICCFLARRAQASAGLCARTRAPAWLPERSPSGEFVPDNRPVVTINDRRQMCPALQAVSRQDLVSLLPPNAPEPFQGANPMYFRLSLREEQNTKDLLRPRRRGPRSPRTQSWKPHRHSVIGDRWRRASGPDESRFFQASSEPLDSVPSDLKPP